MKVINIICVISEDTSVYNKSISLWTGVKLCSATRHPVISVADCFMAGLNKQTKNGVNSLVQSCYPSQQGANGSTTLRHVLLGESGSCYLSPWLGDNLVILPHP